jgi:uridylate kinase
MPAHAAGKIRAAGAKKDARSPSMKGVIKANVPAASERVDCAFLSGFKNLVERHLQGDESRKLIMVTGGGSLAREYQKAFRSVMGKTENDDLDWIGIAATRVNGELVRRMFRQWCVEDLVTDPTAVSVFPGRVMVAAGWKPGFSTDYDAVVLAERFSADTVVNLSDVPRVYSDDPKKNPQARPLDAMTWSDFRSIAGEWAPGKNSPFDPVAARAAEGARIRVIVVDGGNLPNLESLLSGKGFLGTTIGPD